MKVRHTYPSGQTSASKIKALLLCLEAEKGAPSAEALLAKVRLAKGDLDDETRLLPLSALRDAMKAFLGELPDGLDAAASFLVAPDNLGAWARILRGARSPEDAFVRVDSTESEHGRTTRWQRISARTGYWRGRVHVGHDPALEDGGYLSKARILDLTVVPVLFGHERGVVTVRSMSVDTQEFEVRWPVSAPVRSLVIGAAVGGLVSAGVLAVHATPAAAALALAGPLTVGGGAFVASRDRARRDDARAQAMRVAALERSLSLRESAGRAHTGDLEGTVVAGQYRIGARMGSGASGVIYEATRITDGVRVAIKLLRAASAHDAAASDRLRREAEALGLSWHPNVVEVIDHGSVADGTSFLVMELLEGETLASRLRTRHLGVAELYPIAVAVAEALVAIHAAGVVHRDLKPSNIYIVTANGEETVKVFDFGIARVEWEEMRITNMGAPLGTPGYMAPEQEIGGEVDARSDVYALGAVIYECLVGEPPPPSEEDRWTPPQEGASSLGGLRGGFDSMHPRAASGVQPASRMPSTAPAAAAIDVPDAWRVLVDRALARRPEDRFQDARSMLAALRAAARLGGASGAPGGSGVADPAGEPGAPGAEASSQK